jgi:hypothetical protein
MRQHPDDDRRDRHEPGAEPQRDKCRVPRRHRSPGAALTSDPHGRRLAEPHGHHKGDARVVDRDLMRGERVGAEQPDHRRRGHKHTDLQRLQPADRPAQPQDAAKIRSDRAAGTLQRRHRTATAQPPDDAKTQHHQPLRTCRGDPRADEAQRRHAEMAVDQHPVERGIGRHTQHQHNHHAARAFYGRKQAAQHREQQESRRAPAHGAQETTDLMRQRRRIADQVEKPVGGQHRRDHRHRKQHREDQPAARDAAGRHRLAGADRIGGERRHRGQHAEADDDAGEIEPAAQCHRRQRHRAKLADHDGIGHRHRHLRQVRRRQRHSERQGRAGFGQENRGQNRGTHVRPLRRARRALGKERPRVARLGHEK